jgi:hypothetical protein
MLRVEAEAQSRAIQGLVHFEHRGGEQYGAVEVRGTEGRWRVAYIREGELWWELTDAAPEQAAAAVWRWNQPKYRACRPLFDALRELAFRRSGDVQYVEPQRDVILLLDETGKAVGTLSIDESTDRNDFCVGWRPEGGGFVGLSSCSLLRSARLVFGSSRDKKRTLTQTCHPQISARANSTIPHE